MRRLSIFLKFIAFAAATHFLYADQPHVIVANSSPTPKAPLPPVPKKKPDQDYYLIREIKGQGYFWVALGTRWHVLQEGLKLRPGTIVSLENDARIKLNIYGAKEKGWVGSQIQLNVSIPIIFRLERDLVRRIRTGEQFLEKDPDLQVPKFSKETGTVQSAWDKFFAFSQLAIKDSEQVAQLYEQNKDPFQIGTVAKKIRIINPVHGDCKYVLNYPTYLDIYWRPVRKGTARYKVFFWEYGRNKPAALAIADEPFFRVSVSQPGSYYVQISSIDQVYFSEAHLVHFSNTDFDLSDKEKDERKNAIDLGFPPTGTLLIGESKGDAISFGWEYRANGENQELVILPRPPKVASDAQKKQVLPERRFELKAGVKNFSTVIPEGEYSWWIERVVANEKGIIKTPSHKAHFEFRNAKGRLWPVVEEAIGKSRYKSIHLLNSQGQYVSSL